VHWVPSHLSWDLKELDIPGNAVADGWAGDAAQRGRQEGVVNDDKGLDSWSVQEAIMREATGCVRVCVCVRVRPCARVYMCVCACARVCVVRGSCHDGSSNIYSGTCRSYILLCEHL